jgi:hypothetical protein
MTDPIPKSPIVESVGTNGRLALYDAIVIPQAKENIIGNMRLGW